MAVKSKSVLPFLVPKLTTPPVNTKALAILSSVAGESLVKHLEKILPAMIQAVNTSVDGEESVCLRGFVITRVGGPKRIIKIRAIPLVEND